VLAAKEIIISNIALHLRVIKVAISIPSTVAFSFQIEKITLPGAEKGRNNHKNPINAFTTMSLFMILLGGNFAPYKKRRPTSKPAMAADILWRYAMAKARKNTHITLALGSARCKKELPW